MDVPPSEDRRLSSLHIWQIQAVRDGLLIAVVFLLIWLGYAMRTITVPLLIALLLAYLFEPLIELLTRRWRIKRKWGVLGILSSFMVLVILIVVPALALVVSQTAELVTNIRDGKYAGMMEKAVALLPEEYQEQIGDVRAWLGGDSSDAAAEPSAPEIKSATPTPTKTAALSEEQVRQIARDEFARLRARGHEADPSTTASIGWKAFGFVKTGASQIVAIIGDTVAVGLLVFLVPFYFFFFSNAYPRVQRFGRQLIPEQNRDRALFLIGEMDKAVSGFVRGRLVISVILGIVLAIGWFIVGVPYSIALGLVIGVFCAVPYLSIVGLPIAIGLLAVEQYSLDPAARMAWWGVILWPAIVYMIAQMLDDWILTPLIQGKSTKLDPVSIVVAILAGGAIAGLYGMLLAVPVAACIKILLKQVLMPRIKEWTEGKASDPLPGGD